MRSSAALAAAGRWPPSTCRVAAADPHLGRDRCRSRGAPAGRRAARGRRRGRHPRDHDRRARRRSLALARADGPVTRGGAYTYDWIENLLGLNMHSADRVLPEFQQPQVGDTIGFGANRDAPRARRARARARLRSEDGNWVWTFVLSRATAETRLISRNRFRLPTVAARLGMLPMEPASLVMERKMLRGIKARAERLAQGAPA